MCDSNDRHAVLPLVTGRPSRGSGTKYNALRLIASVRNIQNWRDDQRFLFTGQLSRRSMTWILG
jgi:hypothetical protein